MTLTALLTSLAEKYRICIADYRWRHCRADRKPSGDRKSRIADPTRLGHSLTLHNSDENKIAQWTEWRSEAQSVQWRRCFAFEWCAPPSAIYSRSQNLIVWGPRSILVELRSMSWSHELSRKPLLRAQCTVAHAAFVASKLMPPVANSLTLPEISQTAVIRLFSRRNFNVSKYCVLSPVSQCRPKSCPQKLTQLMINIVEFTIVWPTRIKLYVSGNSLSTDLFLE